MGVLMRGALSMTVVALVSAGCHLKNGGFPSTTAGTASPLTWESTAIEPKTVALVDLRSGDTIFEYHIPPGMQLSVQFSQSGTRRPNHLDTPHTMRWTVQKIGKWIAPLNNQIAAPPPADRRLDVFIARADHYVYAEEDRPVTPLEVPMPGIQDFPEQDLLADHPDNLYAVPGAGPVGQSAPPQSPEAPKAPAAPESSDAPTSPETPDPPQVPEATDSPAAPKAPKAPESPNLPEAPASPPATAKHVAAQTWGDTGTARRVAVKDIRTGQAAFEVDVPAGHDLILHFHPMWTPPGHEADVEAMHWEIVPAGQTAAAPAHHATVPLSTHRQIVEQAISKTPAKPESPMPTPNPAPESAPNEAPAATTTSDDESKDTPAPPVDLPED